MSYVRVRLAIREPSYPQSALLRCSMSPRLAKAGRQRRSAHTRRELVSDEPTECLVEPKAVGSKSIEAESSGQHEYQHQPDGTVDLPYPC